MLHLNAICGGVCCLGLIWRTAGDAASHADTTPQGRRAERCSVWLWLRFSPAAVSSAARTCTSEGRATRDSALRLLTHSTLTLCSAEIVAVGYLNPVLFLHHCPVHPPRFRISKGQRVCHPSLLNTLFPYAGIVSQSLCGQCALFKSECTEVSVERRVSSR